MSLVTGWKRLKVRMLDDRNNLFVDLVLYIQQWIHSDCLLEVSTAKQQWPAYEQQVLLGEDAP